MGNILKNLLIVVAIVLVAYNVYTGVTVEKLVIPSIVEFYFGSSHSASSQQGADSSGDQSTGSNASANIPSQSDRCPDETYERLATAQQEEVQMLIEGKPDALTRVFETLGGIDEALKTCPNDARFYMLKGYVQKDVCQSRTPLLSVEQRRKYLFDAHESVTRALQLDPNSVGAHNLMGNILFFEGICDAAIKEYDRALELNRNDGYRKIIEGDKQLAVQARDNNTCTGP